MWFDSALPLEELHITPNLGTTVLRFLQSALILIHYYVIAML